MRRPAVSGAAVFGMGILAAFYMEYDFIIWIIGLTMILIIVTALHLYDGPYMWKKVSILLCLFSLGGLYFEWEETKTDPLTDMCGKTAEIEGIVMQTDFKENVYSIIVKNEESKTLIKYYTEEPFKGNLEGKRIRISGKIELPRQRSNPGCFDYRLYLRSCGIMTILKAEKIMTEDGGIRYLQITGKIRGRFEKKLNRYAGMDTSGIIMAIMFGDKETLDQDIYEDFQKNGTAHVLAVSGLHTGLVYAFFVTVWRFKRGVLFYCITVTLLFMYMSLAEFSPSVVRAVCMIFIHVLACVLKCRYDLFSAAGITFFIMLLVNPFQIFNAGFQLSFIAIVSLAVILPFVKQFYDGVFLSTIAIQAGMVPYTAYMFNYFSVGAIIANIPVVFLTGIILPAGLLALTAMYCSGAIFEFLVVMMEIGCNALVWINSLFYGAGRTSFDVISPHISILVMYYGMLFFCLSETGQLLFIRKSWRTVFKGMISIITVAVLCGYLTYTPFWAADITFVDVGQGDCIHIRTEDDRNYLIDGGGSETYDTGIKILKPYLLKNGVRKIDTAFVTHLHEDHYGGIRALSADGMIDTIVFYEANKCLEKQIMDETDSQIKYIYRGQKIRLGEDVYIEVISPEKYDEKRYKDMVSNKEDENSSSLILKLYYKNATLLITGDIDEDGELFLLKKYRKELDSDIIKVPHHGSKYSSSEVFVEEVSPLLAVFQVGKNNYGHPSQEALEQYKRAGCLSLRNDINGAVGVTVNENGEIKVIDMIH